MSRASTEPGDGASACRGATSADAAPGLSRSTARVMRQVLNAYREGWVLEDRLARAARMVAEDARLQALPPERMLVALKRAWTMLDGVYRLPVLEVRELLSRLVTLSIDAYYASRRPEPPIPSHGAPGARAAA